MHVLQQKHDTLSEIKHNARIAEEALRESSADNATVSDLTRVVASLVDRFDRQSSSTQTAPHYVDAGNSESVCNVMGENNGNHHWEQKTDQTLPKTGQPSQPYSNRQQWNSNCGQSPKSYQGRPQNNNYQQPRFQPQQPQQQPTPGNRQYGSEGQGQFPQQRGLAPRQFSPQRQQGNYRPPTPTGFRQTSNDNECGNCGRQHQQGQCNASNATCYSCEKRGHFARKCRSKQQQQNSSNKY